MSSFRPPQLQNASYAMNPQNNSAPASPPRMGYVSGAGDNNGGMNGYVGQKPARREEPQAPTARRQQLPSLASPNPEMANAAFTQSQFTQNISHGAPGVDQAQSQVPLSRDEQRKQNLRRHKEGGYGGRNRGGSCGITPHPSMSNLSRDQRRAMTRGMAGQNRGLSETPAPAATSESPPTATPASVPVSVHEKPSVFCAYTLSDPNLMYKKFEGSTAWTQIVQLIVPNGKKIKRVYVTAMLGGPSTASPVYSIRLVDASDTTKVLWADYGCDNTTAFKVFTITPSDTGLEAGNLLEVQTQQAGGAAILVSSVLLECQ